MVDIEDDSDTEADESKNRGIFQILIVSITLLTAVAGFYFLLPLITGSVSFLSSFESTSNRLAATSLFASTLLTLALIVVYWDIGGTQQRQVDILENQNELLEAEYRPLIDIDHIKPGRTTEHGWSGDEIVIGIVNVGNGVAHLPRLVIELGFESSNYSPGKKRTLLRPEVDLPDDSEIAIEDHFKNLRTTIPSDNEIHRYHGKITGQVYQDGEEITGAMDDICQSLFDSDIEKIEVGISMAVSDLTGKSYKFDILNIDITEEAFNRDDLDSEIPSSFVEIMARSFSTNMPFEELGISLEVEDLSDISDKTGMILIRHMEMAIEDVWEELEDVDDIEEIDLLENREKK